MSTTKNYYVVLGVPADSSQQEIKAAYRRLAKEFHPDRCRDRHTLFLVIHEAYKVLRDPESRKRYDESIQAAERKLASVMREQRLHRSVPRSSPEWVEPLIPRGEPAFGQGAVDFPGHGASIGSIFERLSTGFPDGVRGGRQRNPVVEVILSPQQALCGGVLRIPVPGELPCPACGGSGERGLFFVCYQCGGTGMGSYDYPLRLEFPPHVPDNYILRVPLEAFGRSNSWLSVCFRIR